MAENLDVRISPALDPETYKSIDGYEDHAQFVGSFIHAMTDVYDVVGKLHDARRHAESNPAWTPANRTIMVSKVADQHRSRVLKRFDLAHTDLAANIAHTEKLLMEPLTEKAGLGSLNGEVRSFVRGLKRGEREAFMNEALARNDEPTLTALLGAQPFLSGMTQLDLDHYLRKYHQKKRPDLVRRLDVMQRFRDRLDGIGPIIHAQFAKAIGEQSGVVAALNRANDQALAALNIEPTA